VHQVPQILILSKDSEICHGDKKIGFNSKGMKKRGRTKSSIITTKHVVKKNRFQTIM